MNKEAILNAAVAEAEEKGRYDLITRGPVAERARCATGLINKHFTDMPTLQSEVLRVFVGMENLAQIAWGLANRHPVVQNLPDDLKTRALNTLVV